MVHTKSSPAFHYIIPILHLRETYSNTPAILFILLKFQAIGIVFLLIEGDLLASVGIR